MAKEKPERGKLVYHQHQLKPETNLDFIEMEGFRKDCEALGLTDIDQAGLRVLITSGPTWAPVIKGTGGLRKIRFAPARWKTGKSGAARVCYVYLRAYSLVLLVKVYSKNQKADLTKAEKNAFKNIIQRIIKQLQRRKLT